MLYILLYTIIHFFKKIRARVCAEPSTTAKKSSPDSYIYSYSNPNYCKKLTYDWEKSAFEFRLGNHFSNAFKRGRASDNNRMTKRAFPCSFSWVVIYTLLKLNDQLIAYFGNKKSDAREKRQFRPYDDFRSIYT